MSTSELGTVVYKLMLLDTLLGKRHRLNLIINLQYMLCSLGSGKLPFIFARIDGNIFSKGMFGDIHYYK